MTQYELELRKLVAPTDDNPHYNSLVEKLAGLFDVIENEEDRKCVAIETLFRATQLVSLAVVDEAYEAYGRQFSCAMCIYDSNEQSSAAETLGNENLQLVESDLRDWIDMQPWAEDKDEYWRIGVCDHMMRFAVYLIYMRTGGVVFDSGLGRDCVLGIDRRVDESGVITIRNWAYPVNRTLLKVINVRKNFFDIKYQEFCEQIGENSFDTIVNSDVSLARLKQIDWSLLSQSEDTLCSFWDLVASSESYDKFGKIVNRLLKMKHSPMNPPIDMKKLRKDAEGMGESVLHRLSLAERWINMMGINVICDEYGTKLTDENNALMETLAETKKQLSEALIKSEESFNLAADYALEVSEAYDRVREEAEKRKAAEAEKQAVETQLKQTEATLESTRKQMEILDGGGARMKKLQDLLDASRKELEERIANEDAACKDAADNARKDMEKEIYERVKVRYRRIQDSSQKRFYLDSIEKTLDRMGDFDDKFEAFENELDGAMAEQTQAAKESEKRDKEMTEALKKIAEKEPTVNVSSDNVNINNAGDTHVSGSHVGTIVDNVNLNNEGK